MRVHVLPWKPSKVHTCVVPQSAHALSLCLRNETFSFFKKNHFINELFLMNNPDSSNQPNPITEIS